VLTAHKSSAQSARRLRAGCARGRTATLILRVDARYARSMTERADHVEAELEIEAPIDLVWAVLVDYPRYSTWNPLLGHIEGEAREGELLTVYSGDGASVGQKAQVCVARVEPPRELRWAHPRRGESVRGWRLQALGPTRTRVVHDCLAGGSALAPSDRSEVRRELGRMNVALRIQAETRFS
jgi:uncharacterized protein YndB with AHSA1/START domain